VNERPVSRLVGSGRVSRLGKATSVIKKYTRKEAEAQVREIKKWCRGLPVLPFNTREGFFTVYKHHEAGRNWVGALSVLATTEKAAGIDNGESIDTGDWEKLNTRFHSAVFAHGDQVGKPCGYDFNNTICAGPLDGKQHKYVCPKCGQTGQYGAPYFQLVG
jgi:hypothetical protein